MGKFTETVPLGSVYRLPTKENKLPFSISVCSKQTEVGRFRFRLQETNGSCRFFC
jgi:hypothetical protein